MTQRGVIFLWVPWQEQGLAWRVSFALLSRRPNSPFPPCGPALPCPTVSANQLVLQTTSRSAASPCFPGPATTATTCVSVLPSAAPALSDQPVTACTQPSPQPPPAAHKSPAGLAAGAAEARDTLPLPLENRAQQPRGLAAACNSQLRLLSWR